MNNKIIFFGSGPVAKKSLSLLVNNFDIEAIVTKPSTHDEMANAAKEAPVYSVSSKQELDELIEKEKFASTTGVLIDFGIIISQSTIDYFSRGIVNSHFSLLPELRGADPITFSILEGKSETGVSLMLLVEAMDEGPVLSQGAMEISKDHTSGSLTDDLINLSDKLLSENLQDYIEGKIEPKDQSFWQEKNGKLVSYTRKLVKSDGVIDWNKSATELEREVRAYLGWPRSRTKLGDLDVVITEAHVMPNGSEATINPGSITIEKKPGCLAVKCGDGNYLCIEKLIPAGKKVMQIDAFVRGYGNRLD